MYHGDPKKFNRVRCDKGHELKGINLYLYNGSYMCKACKKVTDKKARDKALRVQRKIEFNHYGSTS